MGVIRNPFRRKEKEAKPITFESFSEAECNLSCVDILRVIETGDEYRIHTMMLDGVNRRRVYELESGEFLEITPVEGSSWPRYRVTEAGRRYIRAAEGI